MSLAQLLALTDPNGQSDPLKKDKKEPGALEQLLELTRPGREDTQSDWKDAGGSFARGALDSGLGSNAEGSLRALSHGWQAAKRERPGTDEFRRQQQREAAEGYAARRESGGFDDSGYVPPLPDDEQLKVEEAKREAAKIKDDFAQAEKQSGLRAAAEKTADFREAVREVYPVDKDYQKSIAGQFIGAIGNQISQLPAYMAGPAAGMASNFSAMFGQGYDDARTSGADEDTALAAGVLNMPAGVLEYAADKFSLGPIFDLVKAGKIPKKELGKKLREVMTAAAAEGGTEGLQQTLTNVVAKDVLGYAPDRERTEGVGDSVLVGGMLGGAMRGTGASIEAIAERADRKRSALPLPTETDDTGENVPEARETLLAQQVALREGRQAAQMFPKGTEELELPEGFSRVETPRGVFHFDPDQITAEKITQASAAGRENDVLGLGPASKADIVAKARAGEPVSTLVESDTQGREVKAALVTPSTLDATRKEMTTRAAEGNTVQVKNPEAVVASRNGMVADLLQKQTQATAERQAAQERERAEREARQRELAEKRARFDDVMKLAGSVYKNPARTFAELQGALAQARYYAEDNALGLKQEQRELARRAATALAQAQAQMEPQESARREQENRARMAVEARAETERMAKVKADKAAFQAQAAAGVAADGGIDYARLDDERLAELAQRGDKRADREMDRRILGEEGGVSIGEDLRTVLAEIKLPSSDTALGAELGLLKQELKAGEAARYFSTKKNSLDRVAEQLRERGFSQVQTPDDVVRLAAEAFRGKKIFPTGGALEVGFGRSDSERSARLVKNEKPAASLSDERIERALEAVRRANPALLREYDIEGGAVREILKRYADTAGLRLDKVPDGVKAAVTRIEGMRGVIALSAEAFESRLKTAGLLTHEVAHVFWDTLPEQTQRLLREMRAKEIAEKSGPLYEDGKLKSELDGVEDASEWGVKEWFAERVARMNEAWAAGRIAEAGKADTLLKRVAFELREWVRRIWEALAVARGVDPEGELFQAEFRKFWLGGVKTEIGHRAGLAFAKSARDKRLVISNELANREVPVVQLPAKPLMGANPKEVREAALAAAKPWLGKRIKNEMSGEEILVTKDALGHAFGHRGPEHVYAVLALPDMLRSAVKLREEAASPQKPRVQKVHRYASALFIGENFYRVKITVFQMKDGSMLYDHEATEIEKPDGISPAPHIAALGSRTSSGFSIKVSQLFPGFKREVDGEMQVEFAQGKNERQGPLSDDEMAAKVGPASALPGAPSERGAQATEGAEPSWLPSREELGAAMDALDKALPKIDRKDALLAEWRRGKAMRDEGLKLDNEDAISAGQDIVRRMKAQLDEEFLGWEEEAYGDKGRGKSPAPAIAPQSEPDEQPARADEAQEGDGEESPFSGANEAPLPVRKGLRNLLHGQSAVQPSWLAGAWAPVKRVLMGFRGSVPELPTFVSAKTDRFTQEFGANFYDKVKAGYRLMNGINDYVQKESEQRVAAITRPLIEVKGAKLDADGYKRLRRLQQKVREARAENRQVDARTLASLDGLQAKLEQSPYVLFERLVLMLDLNWRQQNLKDSAGNPIKLPFGMNAAEVEVELGELSAKVEASPHRELIGAALEKHLALVSDVATELKGRDLMAAEQLQNPFYFPHLTLEVQRGDKVEQRELRMEKVKPGTEADFRGYLIDPVGSVKPIETDYVSAMYYHLVQVEAHNQKADVVRNYFRTYDVKKEVEARAKKLSEKRGVTVSWEQAFHEEFEKNGYVLYGTDSGDAFPSVSIDREKLAERLGVMLTSDDLHQQLEELGVKGIKILPEDIRETLQMGAKEVWILPAPVKEALRGIADRQQTVKGPWDQVMGRALGAWKRWKLFAPWNHLRYEYGNVVADMEKIFSTDPAAFKYLPGAAKELRAFWQGAPAGDTLRAAMKEGVLNAITAAEMKALPSLPAFEGLQTTGEKVWRQVKARTSSALMQPILTPLGLGKMTSVEASALREAITRYAKFKADYERIKSGAHPVYAGAYWKNIEAMGDSKPGAGDAAVRKAAAISKATFGDYGDISETGSMLREKFIPFYSWMEVNFKYHANVLRNLRDMVRAGEKTKAEAAKAGTRAAAVFAAGMTARAAGAFALRLALPYVAVAAWNAANSDLEDELSEEDKRRFHIVLGRDDDGKVLVVYANTALADVMKWFSGPEMARVATEWMRGRTDFATAFASWRDRLLPDLANNTVGSFGPLAQIPAALGLKKRMFPDVTDPRTIPDYDMRRVVLGMATDDFTADMLERVVNKDYYAAKDFGDWAQQLVLQVRQRDPEAWAYYAIRDKAAEFTEARTGAKRDTSYDAPDQQALRNFRKAIYAGDVEAATKFYLRALDYGYTAERFAASVRAQDPLAMLAKKDGLRREFVAQLSEFDRAQLERAFRYYERMDVMRGRERGLFPADRGGDRAVQQFQQTPRLGQLQGLLDASMQAQEAEVERRAKRALERSLR